MNKAQFRHGEIEWLQRRFEPGESLVDAYFIESSLLIFHAVLIVALSNRYLRIIRVVKTVFRGWIFEELEIIPISEISDITSAEKDGTHVLTFFWKGNREELSSKSVQEAREFKDNLKRLVSVEEETRDSGGISGEIEKLASLTDKGILTEEELTRAKEVLLGKPEDRIDKAIRLLKSMKELEEQGVLSESEFNMKKWDILSKDDIQ